MYTYVYVVLKYNTSSASEMHHVISHRSILFNCSARQLNVDIHHHRHRVLYTSKLPFYTCTSHCILSCTHRRSIHSRNWQLLAALSTWVQTVHHSPPSPSHMVMGACSVEQESVPSNVHAGKLLSSRVVQALPVLGVCPLVISLSWQTVSFLPYSPQNMCMCGRTGAP